VVAVAVVAALVEEPLILKLRGLAGQVEVEVVLVDHAPQVILVVVLVAALPEIPTMPLDHQVASALMLRPVLEVRVVLPDYLTAGLEALVEHSVLPEVLVLWGPVVLQVRLTVLRAVAVLPVLQSSEMHSSRGLFLEHASVQSANQSLRYFTNGNPIIPSFVQSDSN
jgi:hypothetical protein